MKNTSLYVVLCAAILVLTQSCKPDLDVTPEAGTANFTKYISVGNSLTAGFADNGLYLAGQQVAYPNLLAQQMKQAGGGEFMQPLFSQRPNGTGYLVLKGFLAPGVPDLQPVTTNRAELAIRGTTTPNPQMNPMGLLFDKYTDPINNYGVPGLRLSDVIDPTYGSKNPLYERILTDTEVSGGKTYLSKIYDPQSTFFTCWLGNNDALQYALSGGMAPLTPTVNFTGLYTLVIDTLIHRTAPVGAAKGAVANIPSVTSIPYFNTVLGTVTSLAKTNLTAALGASGTLAIQTGTPSFTGTANPTDPLKAATLKIADLLGGGSGRALFTDGIRQNPAYLQLIGRPGGKYWRDLAAQNNIPVSLVVSTYKLDTTKAFGLVAENPFPTGLVFDAREQDLVNETINAYNTSIQNIAQSKNLAFVNANAYLNSINKGIVEEGISVSGSFITGGVFSLDGVHLTPRGNALMTNAFIRFINARYNSKLPLVQVSAYPGVKLP